MLHPLKTQRIDELVVQILVGNDSQGMKPESGSHLLTHDNEVGDLLCFIESKNSKVFY